MLSIVKLGFVFLLALGNTQARDFETKTQVKVRPGWTESKAEYSALWNNLTNEEKQNRTQAFSVKLEKLKQDIKDHRSNPRKEDGGKDLYTYLSEKIYSLKSNLFNAELAAEINERLEGAERVINYSKTHPFTGNGPVVERVEMSGDNGTSYTPLGEGSGWINTWVQDSGAENCLNPVICSAGDYLFAAVQHRMDNQIIIYRSSDMGGSWEHWAGFLVSGSTIYPGQIAYDSQRGALLVVSTVSTNNNDILFVRYNDINDPSNWTYSWVANTNDAEAQGQLSVEYTSSADRICIMFHNGTTSNDVIVESSDTGNTWSTVYTSTWTGGWDGAPRGAQGNNGGIGKDVFLFVTSLPDTDKVTVLVSASGVSGSWTATELQDPFSRFTKDADIAGSHSTTVYGAMIVYNAVYSSGENSIRGWWTPNTIDSSYRHFYIDDRYFSDTLASPRVTVDGEFTGETPPSTDFYHVAYYADLDTDGRYRIIARRTPNDWTYIGDYVNYWRTGNANETWLGDTIGMVTANYIWDYGTPAAWYQIDNTTLKTGNTTTPYIPSIVWLESLSGENIVLSSTVSTTSAVNENPAHNGSLFNARILMEKNATYLNFALPQASRVKIRIFDAKGALLKDLSGNYGKMASIKLNAKHAGTFFAVINYREQSRVLKFTQIK